jgi:Predicted kinase
MKRAILVNGVPASGKTTVARAIAARLGVLRFALDSVKEPFFDELGLGDREFNRALGRASYHAIFRVLADAPDGVTVVIDAWFGFQPRAVLDRHLAMAGIDRLAEVWCHAPPNVLVERYRARLGERHPGHPGEAFLPELDALARRAAPLGLSPFLSIDTTELLDEAALAAFLAGLC